MPTQSIDSCLSALGFISQSSDVCPIWINQTNGFSIEYVPQGKWPVEIVADFRIWYDQWERNADAILQHIKTMISPVKSVFARDTRIISIHPDIARRFLDANHLMGFSKGNYYLGCIVPPHRHFRGIFSAFFVDENPLLAVAVFGKNMRMNEIGLEGKLSAELIKIASLQTIRLVGGLTKFLQAFHAIEPVDNVMTYIDREQSSGKGFLSIGFRQIAQTQALYFSLDHGKRVLVNTRDEANVCNAGNLKLRYTYAN